MKVVLTNEGAKSGRARSVFFSFADLSRRLNEKKMNKAGSRAAQASEASLSDERSELCGSRPCFIHFFFPGN